MAREMIELKKVTNDQIKELQKISRQTFADTFGADNTDSDMELYLDQTYGTETLLAQLANPNSIFFFAWKDGNVVGYLKVNLADAQTEKMGNDSLEIERIYVQKDFKSQGFGSKLFQQALSCAREQKKAKVWLGVWERNYAALKFYNKQGFKQIGAHVFQLGDDAQRDLLLQLEL